MRYKSTRGDAQEKHFTAILLEGLARDGGLYVPERYPQLDLGMLRSWCMGGKREYADIAFHVLSRFIGDMKLSELRTIVTSTYSEAHFGSRAVTPVDELEDGIYRLQLSHGPTLAFKDIALQLLGNLMQTTLEKRRGRLNILGATSGDTGSAAAYALRGKSCMNLFMLSSRGRMSPFQERQMYTLQDRNIHNIAVNGTFDDCQAVVKAVNADAAFKEEFAIGAINSINWARIAAQTVYYVSAWLQVATSDTTEVSFSVPSGNFGNALSAHVARRMGVPIRDIIVATNENDVLHEFFSTGTYVVRKGAEVKSTHSPSMDIAAASNIERYIFDVFGENPIMVRTLFTELATKGRFSLHPSDQQAMTKGMRTASVSDHETIETIRSLYTKSGIVIDPHTAVGLAAARALCEPGIPCIVAETALPAKFEGAIRQAIGRPPEVPEEYRKLIELPYRVTRMDPDPEAVKAFIRAHA